VAERLLRIAPFNVRLASPIPAVWRHVEAFYPGAAVADPDTFVDFDVELLPGRGLRRWMQPQVRFLLDADEPFHPLPRSQAAPMFEWGLNWCVAQRALGWLVLHAAVLEKDGLAIVLPGFPGAGKSTLCASLALLDGWRLLSDELTIVDPADDRVVPHPRPISLKNESIGIVAGFPGAWIGPTHVDTRKGTIAHAAVPRPAREAADERARVAWVVFPRFEAGAGLAVEPITRVEAFTAISEQSFNRERMGAVGFQTLCRVLDGARSHELVYGSTADALEGVRRICAGSAP
jgi:HprK-related kinase A